MRKIIRKKETQNLPTIKDTLLSQPMVGQHLKFLKEHGADRTIVLGLLAIISRLVRVPDSADWADESGKTTVTLNRFPARIEGLASDIERIDAYGLLDPAVGVSALWTA